MPPSSALARAPPGKLGTTTEKDFGIPDGYIILILHAGTYDHTCLETHIQQQAPWMTPYVLALDESRDKSHDMTSYGLYNHLCNKAARGELLAIIG